jgi:hypothetical protein
LAWVGEISKKVNENKNSGFCLIQIEKGFNLIILLLKFFNTLAALVVLAKIFFSFAVGDRHDILYLFNT